MSENHKEYIAIISKKNNRQYDVFFPDFLGCITSGNSFEDAKNMAQEALQLHVDGMIEDGDLMPSPQSLDVITKKYKTAKLFFMVKVKFKIKFSRINITIDEKLLKKLDKYLLNQHQTRSSFFAKSIMEID